MLAAKDKFELFNHLSSIMQQNLCSVEPYQLIQYGLQFYCHHQGKKELVRIYEGKKGIRLDLSMVDAELARKIGLWIGDPKLLPLPTVAPKGQAIKFESIADPETLIGIDESGKGDYFGPLVIAAVYCDEAKKAELKKMGVRDCKSLPDAKVIELSKKIQSETLHSAIVIGNPVYNNVYQHFKNLNLILGWGHAKVLENVLYQTPCAFALSDQFGDPSIIKRFLMSQGKTVTLLQRHKAEDNIAVAAASVLARGQFLLERNKLESRFGMSFPKGSSEQTIVAAKQYVEKFGTEALDQIAKLHFKQTEKILESLKNDEG
ncbi:MAG: ribonuclease HIII [Candidatus Margulisiibacteriota bacterium]